MLYATKTEASSTIDELLFYCFVDVTEVQMPTKAQSWMTFSLIHSHIKVIILLNIFKTKLLPLNVVPISMNYSEYYFFHVFISEYYIHFCSKSKVKLPQLLCFVVFVARNSEF